MPFYQMIASISHILYIIYALIRYEYDMKMGSFGIETVLILFCVITSLITCIVSFSVLGCITVVLFSIAFLLSIFVGEKDESNPRES